MKCLEGIKVVELSTFVAAASAGRVLADQGADVIKVESLKGDDWRFYFPASATEWTVDENPVWEIFNINKRSLSLDLKSDDGKAVLHELLRSADVLITNYRTKALRKLGIDYDSIKEEFPRLVYAQVTSYGQKGQYCDDPGFDSVAFWARSGFMLDLVAKGGYPLHTPGGVGDSICGTSLYGGICSALYARERTGMGDHVEVSLYGTAIWTLAMMGTVSQDVYGNEYPKSRVEYNPYVSCYKTKDDQWCNITIATNFKETIDKIFTVLDAPEFVDLPMFSSMTESFQYKPQVYAIFEELYGRYEYEELYKRLSSINVPCQRLRHFKEMSTDSQALDNGYFSPFTFDSGKTFELPNPPIRFRNAQLQEARRAGRVGENSEEVLMELGYSKAQISELKEKKTIS